MCYFKKALISVVFVGFSAANAGSYEDFWTAIKRDNAWAVSQLLARGFDPNTVDPKGQHSLTQAIYEESYQAASVLAGAAKVDLNHLNAAGESALMMAALKGQAKLAAALIARGADVNKTGWTPLHYAATNGDVATVRLLLENHAFVDSESPNGTTPLMMAAQYGSPEAVQLLLAEGAQHSQKNQLGLTALDFAQRGARPDAIKLLSALARQSAPVMAEPAVTKTPVMPVKPLPGPGLNPDEPVSPGGKPEPKPPATW